MNTDTAGTLKSPRFIFAAVAFISTTVLMFMGKIDTGTYEILGGAALTGYMLNNAVKGLLVKK